MLERAETDDALFGGALKLTQPARGSGYRANVDAILLAAFAVRSHSRAKTAVDLGAGAGAVGLSALYLGAADQVTFVERNERLVALCASNAAENGFDARARVVLGDLEASLAALDGSLVHACDLVLANPPYFAKGSDARAAQAEGERARARHALGRRGRACFVYPSDALLDLMCEARKLHLEPKRLRLVHGKADRPARVALVELVSGRPGGLVVTPPLVETRADGKPSAEIEELLRTRAAPS
jgi:tRNA1Val (adenine37-N6)-methyltransferase